MPTPKAAIARAAAAVQPVTKRWPATLSDVNGNITPGRDASVPGRPGQVYAVMPDGAVVAVYNTRVAATTGARVWIGYEPHNPSLLRVLDFNASYIDPSTSGGFGPHHATHEYLNPDGGGDVVYPQARQLMPLRLSVVSGMTVKVEPSPEAVSGGWALSTTATLNLAPDVPGSGALYALVYLTAAGVLARRLGAAVGAFGALAYSNIPALAAGERALAAIALRAGQTVISESRAQQDVVDLRFASFTAGGMLIGTGTPGRVAAWATAGSLGDSPLTVDTAMHVKPLGAASGMGLGFDGTDWVPTVFAGGGGGGGAGGGPAEFSQSEYSTADIALGTAVDAGWVDADAANAAISIIPSASGTYRVTCNFSHYASWILSGSLTIAFRLFDGATASNAVTIAVHPVFNGEPPREHPVSLSELFTWAGTSLRTVKLQKMVTLATTITNNLIQCGSGLGAPVLHLDIFRLGGGSASPLTTKGDLWGYGAADARLPVGANTTVLTADSTQALGVKWAAGGGSSLGWFNVKAYGALGDGATDDTAAVTAAIAALTAAGRGVLYFPAGVYKTSGGFTLSVPSLVLGDGNNGIDWGNTVFTAVTEIQCTSATANLFQVTDKSVSFEKLVLNCLAATPSAGAGILYDGPGGIVYSEQHFQNLTLNGFYVDLKINTAMIWRMDQCEITGPVLYGIQINNLFHGDWGNFSIVGCHFHPGPRNGATAIRYESAGGAVISDCDFDGWRTVIAGVLGGTVTRFDRVLDLVPSGDSSGLQISNCTFENWHLDAIRVVSTSAIHWDFITITGTEFGGYDATGYAIVLSAATLGVVKRIVIGDCVLFTNTSTTAAIGLTNIAQVRISDCVWDGFAGGFLTQSGCADVAVVEHLSSFRANLGAATNGQVPVYDAATGTWLPGAGGGGGGSGGAGPIMARYKTDTAQSFTNGVGATVNYDTLDFDSNGAVTTGAGWVFTAPVAGTYLVSAAVILSGTSGWANGEQGALSLFKNGSFYSNLLDQSNYSGGAAQYMNLIGSDTINLAAGDTLTINLYQASGATLTLLADAHFNYVNIFRLSNSGAVVGFTQTATVTVANTVTETPLTGAGVGTLTIPANGLIVGRTLRLEAWGSLTTKAIPAGVYTLQAYLGSTLVATTGTTTLVSDVLCLIHIQLYITCRSVGASGTVMAKGVFDIVAAIERGLGTGALGVTTIDTTIAQTLGLTFTFGTADVLNTISLTNLTLETLN